MNVIQILFNSYMEKPDDFNEGEKSEVNILCEMEQEIITALKNEEALFRRFLEAEACTQLQEVKHGFISGFRLGAQMMMEIITGVKSNN